MHYGAWAMFLTSPVLVLLTAALLEKFAETMNSIGKYVAPGMPSPHLKELVDSQLASISLNGRSRFLLAMFILIGLLMVALDVRASMNPLLAYGYDTFDSYAHVFGFTFNRIYLAVLWGLVYPTALFVALHATFSTMTVVIHLCGERILRIRVFNPDHCGGLSSFGKLNTLAMGIYACLFVVLFGLQITASRNGIILAAALICITFFAQYIGGTYHLHAYLKEERNRMLNEVSDRLELESGHPIGSGSFSRDLYGVRSHLLSIRTVPYSKSAFAAENLFRIIPLAIAAAKLFS